MTKNAICFVYDGDADEAATFYARTFPANAVGDVMRAPRDYPNAEQENALSVEFTVIELPCVGLNEGADFP